MMKKLAVNAEFIQERQILSKKQHKTFIVAIKENFQL